MDRSDFDQLYAQAPDPYGVRTRWYEARKRALLLAALPRARYGRAFEPGCGVGELTSELAGRCDTLLATDFSAGAVAAARERTRGFGHVQVAQQDLPDEWPQPEGGFDLIVLSEIGYFLGARDMACVAQLCAQTLASQGTVFACHWTVAFDGRRMSTRTVHGMLDALGLPRTAHYEDADFRLAVWERRAESVAQREGIRASGSQPPDGLPAQS